MFPSITQSQQRALGDRSTGRPSEPVRIGVFVCHCGHNIAGYLDVPALVESARTLPHVVFAHDSLFTCSDAGLAEIRTAIAEHNLNRVVVASCTPRTHEPLFQAACQEGGLNRYLFEFVNIRDQCSWVHMNEGERATQKAQDLIRMGVAKAALLEPLEEVELAVQPAAAVIGGGIAGMTAARNLASRGFAVTLLEREPELGGMLRHLNTLYPTGAKASELVERQIAKVRDDPHIEVLTSAEVREARGYIGNYELMVHSKQFGMDLPVQAGVIIIATGAEELKPVGTYGYGSDPRVVTQQELEGLLSKNSLPLPDANRSAVPARAGAQSPKPTVVMIQCVGARDETHSYCGRTCCLTAMKNAMLLKERDPETEVHVLYRDIEVHGTHFEDYYAEARELGVIFSRYTPEEPPQVGADRVIVYDELLGMRLGIPYDLLVLSTPMVPRPGARQLAQMFKVPVDEYGFFLEAHVKLRPLDFATDGIYLCGSAHWPAHLDEAISQAYGAAARSATILSKEQIRASGVVAQVDEYLCRGCERCADVCEFGAIEFTELERKASPFSIPVQPTNRKVAQVNPVMCKGCGACAVVCPTCAMQASHFSSEQVAAMIQAALGG
jgi:heterodisulfide reductase subunit A